MDMQIEFEPIPAVDLQRKEYVFHYGHYRHVVETDLRGTSHQVYEVDGASPISQSHGPRETEEESLRQVINIAEIYGYRPKAAPVSTASA